MELTEAIMISIGSGAVCAVATVAALKTDIGWIKREVIRLEDAITRAHDRIDQIEKRT